MTIICLLYLYRTFKSENNMQLICFERRRKSLGIGRKLDLTERPWNWVAGFRFWKDLSLGYPSHENSLVRLAGHENHQLAAQKATFDHWVPVELPWAQKPHGRLAGPGKWLKLVLVWVCRLPKLCGPALRVPN